MNINLDFWSLILHMETDIGSVFICIQPAIPACLLLHSDLRQIKMIHSVVHLLVCINDCVKRLKNVNSV